MARKLYIGGLPYAATDERLREVFAEHGNVESANVIVDRQTGQSRGFGFVEMSTEEEAQAAVRGLHETLMDGRTITVAEARPKDDRGGGGGGGGGGGRRDRW
jgi:RNA recognition motif-containing protein